MSDMPSDSKDQLISLSLVLANDDGHPFSSIAMRVAIDGTTPVAFVTDAAGQSPVLEDVRPGAPLLLEIMGPDGSWRSFREGIVTSGGVLLHTPEGPTLLPDTSTKPTGVGAVSRFAFGLMWTFAIVGVVMFLVGRSPWASFIAAGVCLLVGAFTIPKATRDLAPRPAATLPRSNPG